MEMVTLRGIVLREYPVGENDKFIHIFTRERGVIEVSVRGGRKMVSKNAGGSQLFAYSDFSIRYDKGRYYLDSCQIIRLFYSIREDLDRLSLANYIAEVVSYTTGHHEQKEDVMRLLLNTFHYLSNGERECRFLKSVFEMRFLTEIGMMPDIVCCHTCMKYSAEYMCFDMLSTKLYCSECYKGSYDGTQMTVSFSVIHALRHIVFADFNRLFNFTLSPENMKKLSVITEKYLLIHLGKEFKTLDFYKSLGN
ncbi:MAG: DNA repair protein RecO [Porcipelethomonas sp.]